ncbi:MAG TPA: response regulator transcription factor [Lacunisphaera sp.]|nr:response regulator transcription factor [Lacunisphaera sp.]
MRILVIEDESQLARHLTGVLSRNNHLVSAQSDGSAGLAEALKTQPDLVVLDIGLPGLSGWEVLDELHEQGSTSRVLVLTARGDVEDRVKGLKAGADDYLTKPFSMEEFVARVEALGRRGQVPTAGDLLTVDDLQMDVRRRKVRRAGREIALSPREFELLQVMMAEPGRVFSRTELCERVWQRDYEYDTRTVEIFIGRLRRKIDSSTRPPLVHTVRSVGYSVRLPA